MGDNFQLPTAATTGDKSRSKSRGGSPELKAQIVIVDKNIGGSEDITGAFPAQGDVAHDGADSGNPVKIGRKAISIGSDPTPVQNGDRTDNYANLHGIPFSISGHPNTLALRAVLTGSASDQAILTVGGGNKIVVTQITVAVGNDVVGSPSVLIGLGTSTTPSSNKVAFSHPAMASGGFYPRGDGSGIIAAGGDGDDLRVTLGSFSGGNIEILVTYHILPS